MYTLFFGCQISGRDKKRVKTFTESREFVTYLGYYQDREKAIAALDLDSTDEPIVDIVSAFADQRSKKIHLRFRIKRGKFKMFKNLRCKGNVRGSAKKVSVGLLHYPPQWLFSDISKFYAMAKKGGVYLFGNGELEVNPIHGEDLAEVCVDAIEKSDQEIKVGGPEILTHNEIAVTAFDVLDIKPKITNIPDWIRNVMLKLVRIFTVSKFYGPIEFSCVLWQLIGSLLHMENILGKNISLNGAAGLHEAPIHEIGTPLHFIPIDEDVRQ